MWHELASPPENFRYYKFTDNSAEHGCLTKDVDLEENRTCLFQPRKM